MSGDDRLDAGRTLLGAVVAVTGLVLASLIVHTLVHPSLPAEATAAAAVVPLSLAPAGRDALGPGGEHPAVPLGAAPQLYEIPKVLP